MARKFNRSTNVLSSNFSSALDRNTGVNVMQRLSDLIAQVYSEDFYKFQSNTFFALVIAQTGQRATDIRTARNTFSKMQHQRDLRDPNRIETPNVPLYPSCKVRILETGHAFIGDPTDPNGVFNYNRLDQYADGTRPNRLKALNVAFIDMHGFPAYTNAGITPPEYGDVVLVEVDNISDPKDIKILEIVARKIIEPLGFTAEENNPPPPDGNNAVPEADDETLSPDQDGLLPEAKQPDLDSYDRLKYFIFSTTKRNRAVQPVLLERLQALAEQTDTWLEIFSAGQPSRELITQHPGTYTEDIDNYRQGTNRHDFGWAVDVRIRNTEFNSGRGYENFIEVNTDDVEITRLLKDFAEKAYALGITGIGAGKGYMNSTSGAGKMHLDMAYCNNPEGEINPSRRWGGFRCEDGVPPSSRTTAGGEVFSCFPSGRQSAQAPDWLKQAAGVENNGRASCGSQQSLAQATSNTSQQEEVEEAPE